MDAIINFFASIGEVISSTFSLIWSFILDLVQIILMLSKFLGQITSFTSWLPDSLSFLLVSVFTIAVVYKIAGREG